MACSAATQSTEMYRSGRNGGASKASCRVTGTWVRIPPSPPPSRFLQHPAEIHDAPELLDAENGVDELRGRGLPEHRIGEIARLLHELLPRHWIGVRAPYGVDALGEHGAVVQRHLDDGDAIGLELLELIAPNEPHLGFLREHRRIRHPR